jgi:glycerol-3-phosphate cytidylyltransferase-like family protein
LTVGHIRCIRWLEQRYADIIIGLLTDEAMEEYKNPIVLFKDRLEILKYIARDKRVVAQNSLDPSENIEKYKPDAIASGDGWENVEEDAIKKYNLVRIDIPFPKEHSSSNIIKKIQNETNSCA